jgi:hypothetical protein
MVKQGGGGELVIDGHKTFKQMQYTCSYHRCMMLCSAVSLV